MFNRQLTIIEVHCDVSTVVAPATRYVITMTQARDTHIVNNYGLHNRIKRLQHCQMVAECLCQ